MIKDGKPGVFLDGPEYEHPNGLLVENDKLIIAGWGKNIADDFTTATRGRVLSVDLKTKKMSPLTAKPLGNLDGIESDGKGGYLVTDWMSGKVHHVSKTGTSTTLATYPQGAADHAYLPKKRLLILPQMVEHKITAFTLSD
ncbi:hypothetical protein [Haloferula sp.]|uniref:hypothetical protein n=1 Tax=Haloferula sp. TaxID=2497595 RepID=UPI00329AC306